MTRLNLLLAATTSTLLLTISSARAAETVTDMSIEAAIQTDRVAQAIEDQASGDAIRLSGNPSIASDKSIASDDLASESELDLGVDSDAGVVAEVGVVEVGVVETEVIEAEVVEAEVAEAEVAEAEVAEAETELVDQNSDVDVVDIDVVDIDVVDIDGNDGNSDVKTRSASARTDREPIAITTPAIATPSPSNTPIAANTANSPSTLDGLIAQGGEIKLRFNDNAPAPRYLNPRPNPLNFPTLAEDVTIIGDQPISLNQAIELALHNNIDLQNSQIGVLRQQETLRSTQAALWPQLDLSSSFTWSDSASSRISIQRQLDLTGDRSILQTDPTGTSWNTELRLRYNIFTSGSRDANINSARERLRLLELEVERQTEATRLSVSEAYYNIQNADQQVIIAESAIVNSEKSLVDAQALERAGVGTQFDVLRSEVQLANDQQRLRQTQSDQRVARRTLARLLELPPNLEVSAGDPIELAGTWNLPLEETIILAFRSRAELEQQLAQREIARQEQRAARAAALPQLAAFASVNLLGNSGDGVGGLTDGYTAGLQFSWQLFNGGSTGAAVRDQELAQQSAELEFANQRGQVRLQVEQSYYQLEASLENVSTSETALKLAKDSLELARLRFQAGVGTQTEVIGAQDDLTQALGNRVTAIIGYNQALANLRRAVGNHPLRDEIDAML